MVNDGATTGQLPVSILADTIPELDEAFLVKLTQIEVASAEGSLKYPPQLGQLNQARVTINKNDNAFGIFRVVSESPQASGGGTAVGVEEKPQLAVDLVVERLGIFPSFCMGDFMVIQNLNNELRLSSLCE